MKKSSYILMLALCAVFCASAIGINVIYWKHFPALYLAGIIVGSIAFFIAIACLLLELIKKDKEEAYYKTLMRISMISAVVAVGLPVVAMFR